MKLTFLKASIPLTKTFTKTASGYEKSSYPNVFKVSSIDEECRNLNNLVTILEKHGALGHCLLKGNVKAPLINQSRAESTDSLATTDLLLFDVDGLAIKSPEEFMKAIGMSDVSYVVQYSTSYKIENNLLRCHIFVWLDTPIAAPVLKQYLIAMNFAIPLLKNALTLTKTGNALHYGLDITTCQNDKLVYIADPICIGFTAPIKRRIEYIKKKKLKHTFKEPPPIVVNRAQVEDHIKELRKKVNLPERKNVYKMDRYIEVLKNPDRSMVTGIKEERGFTYLNLNGGDSWGYYHPTNNPDFIHNFKGEPTYITKELVPEYWQDVGSRKKASTVDADGKIHLAFVNWHGSSYWRGFYDQTTDELDIGTARNESQVRDYAKQVGLALPDFIPTWEMSFDPHNPVRVDIDKQVINTFQPTVYMKPPQPFMRGKKSFDIIKKVIHHALGSDDAIYERFINWLAVIAQTFDRACTAWVLHGCSGTGKGLLMNNILRPLFGDKQVALKRLSQLTEAYNGYLEKCFFVFVDEVQTSTLRNEKSVMADLKNYITEDKISVRYMYHDSFEVRNYTNWIFASNMPDPVLVDMNDRRFNVGKYQQERIEISKKEIEGIEGELQAFWTYLSNYPADREMAGTPMETEDRKTLMQISVASIDTVANALLEGDFEFFLDQLPTRPPGNNVMMDIVESYKATLTRILARNTTYCNVSREELRDIFEYTVGDMPPSPNKFTSRLKHHRIHTTRLSVDGVVSYGIHMKWHNIPGDAHARLSGKPQAATTQATPITKKKEK